VDQTNHFEQVTKGPRHAKRHAFQNCPDDVCREHNQHKHHLYMKQDKDQSPSVDYIVVAMSDILYDQTAHSKVCSIHHYEKKKTDEKDDDPKLSNLYNLVISSTILVARTCLGYFRSLITTW
jgi:hypothetical protein